jgi:4-carboxymuconolactone decarboxylase
MIWGDKTLEPKIKEVTVLAAMVAQDLEREIYTHVKSGLNLGLTRDEINALNNHCTPYSGYPKVNHGLNAAMKAFADVDAEAKKAKPKKKAKKK